MTDGAGRVRAVAQDHPGSTGQYSGQYTVFDVMGRVSQQSNPTEMNYQWAAAGDDASAGWIYTQQAYDWKDRPTVTTNPDNTTRVITYGGCGCAGGEVVTAKDEAGRQRRTTADVLGRLAKVEELDWSGGVYATANYTYDVLDHPTRLDHQGQQRSLGFDGYGRLQSRTTPEQGTTTYSYFADDTVQTVTDARGATTTFTYNARRLVTAITYGVPAGVAATANVTMDYDGVGNRLSMTDGLGRVDYAYDQLSRLTSETRTFNGVGSFGLSYGYNRAGELTSITGPSQFGSVQVGYNYDKIGRPTSVAGANYAGVTSYINSIAYRAFGMKQMAYNNGRTLSLSYDNRLRLTRWDTSGVMGWNYAYNYFSENNGRVTYAQNLYDNTLDRSYQYDHVGRLVSSHTGQEARAHTGQSSDWTITGPYSQDRSYDQFGNATNRTGWGGYQGGGFSYNYTFANNRLTQDPATGAMLQYDAAGNLTNDGSQIFSYDATGQQATASYSGYSLTQDYDGAGLRARKNDNGTVTYYLRSSVLGGQVVAEMNSSGALTRGYVYLGEMIAVQAGGTVSLVHHDPVTKSKRVTDNLGNVVSTVDLDPWGGETSRSSNQGFQPHRYTTYERDANGGDDAMHRRYQSYWNRFSQPDPYDGSYESSDLQSFNRYTYTQNDPVNFVDPSGLCTFNIDITGTKNISQDALTALQNEISRIFGQAGQTVNFGSYTGGITYHMNLADIGASVLPGALGSTRANSDGSISNYGAAYLNRISDSLANDPSEAMRTLSRHPTNFGTAVGRVIAHEVGHYLLQLSNTQHTASGLMRAQFRGDSSLFRRGGDFDRAFQFSAMQRLALNKLCQPLTTTTPTLNNSPIMRPLIGGGGGFGGYPSWLDSMRDFLDWLDSIEVGSGGYGEVVGYQIEVVTVTVTEVDEDDPD